MSFLLDTNVVSEWVRPQPDPGVMQWLAEVDEDRVYLSVVTVAELRFGIARLANGARRSRLDQWLRAEMLPRFDDRILPVDTAVAVAWGDVTAERAAAGRPIEAMDALIAATARVHALTLVTRNVADFGGVVPALLSPWT